MTPTNDDRQALSDIREWAADLDTPAKEALRQIEAIAARQIAQPEETDVLQALRDARWYVAEWSDEYSSTEGVELLTRIDSLLGKHAND